MGLGGFTTSLITKEQATAGRKVPAELNETTIEGLWFRVALLLDTVAVFPGPPQPVPILLTAETEDKPKPA